MPTYFASDIHLRLDRPDRALRFGRWVDGLAADDSLTIVGDLCDFWFAARQRRADPLSCDGLRALVEYRERGGAPKILLGNHDAWLGPFYERSLGLEVLPEPLRLTVEGLSLHLVHGHIMGARPSWKKVMESRAFLDGFARAPAPLANALAAQLERTNDVHRAEADRRHLVRYRAYADALSPAPDLAVFGHIHATFDDRSRTPRIVVLGDWLDGGSFLKIDEAGAALVHLADGSGHAPAAQRAGSEDVPR